MSTKEKTEKIDYRANLYAVWTYKGSVLDSVTKKRGAKTWNMKKPVSKKP